MAVTKHVSKHNLLTIPAELTEAIAMALDKPDLLNLRLISKAVADRTEKVFVTKYVTNMTWRLWGSKKDFGMKHAKILEIRPDFAQHVKDVCLKFDKQVVYSTSILATFTGRFNQLQNLRTPQIHGLAEYPDDP